MKSKKSGGKSTFTMEIGTVVHENAAEGHCLAGGCEKPIGSDCLQCQEFTRLRLKSRLGDWEMDANGQVTKVDEEMMSKHL